MASKQILAVTTVHDDNTFLPLEAAVAARGGRLIRFDTGGYPTESSLDVRPLAGRWEGTLRLAGGEEVVLHELHAIWLRRLDAAARLPKGLPPAVGTACRRECDSALQGVLGGLGCPLLDDPIDMLRGELKPRQLVTAQAAGLPIPPTLLTNRAASARSLAETEGPLITKLLAAMPMRGRSGSFTMATSAVGEEDLAALTDESLSLAPSLFQRRLPKAAEARALVIGDRILSARVDAQQTAGAEVDWRQGFGELADTFEPFELPEAFREGLLRFARAMGLRYGAADLILTPEGEWVFLEMNPAGEWGWLQDIGLPVADALAELLLEGL